MKTYLPPQYTAQEIVDMLIGLAYERYDEGAEDCWIMQAAEYIKSQDISCIRETIRERMSETADDWETRCGQILSILGLDYGQDWPKPIRDGQVLKTADEIRLEERNRCCSILLNMPERGIPKNETGIWNTAYMHGVDAILTQE